MKVIIKLKQEQPGFVLGKEYEATKHDDGYFAIGDGVSRLISFDEARELECKYAE